MALTAGKETEGTITHIPADIHKAVPSEFFIPHGSANAEMRWGGVRSELYLTPTDRFFVRSLGGTTEIDPTAWRLRIEGAASGGPRKSTSSSCARSPR